MAYRFILGRDPENEPVIEEKMRVKDIKELSQIFFDSREFHDRWRNIIPPMPLFMDAAPRRRVDIEVTRAQLNQLLQRVEHCWERLGQSDPHWSVLTTDAFKRDSFEANADAFYQSGARDVDRLVTWLARNHIDPTSLQTCLELGCGTGRITPWLARRFRSIYACDISEPHLRLAEDRVRQVGLSNVTFIQTARFEALQLLPQVDMIFSVIVLQHNPPPVMAAILQCLLGCLVPGGLAFFQVPTYGITYAFDVNAYLAAPPVDEMEMHVFPQSEMFRLLREAHCDVLEVQVDNYTGLENWVSNTFLVQKKS